MNREIRISLAFGLTCSVNLFEQANLITSVTLQDINLTVCSIQLFSFIPPLVCKINSSEREQEEMTGNVKRLS